MKKNKDWLKNKVQSQVVVITFLCVVCCIMMLATIAVCTVNILTMVGHDDPVYHSSIMLSLIIEHFDYRYCGIYPALHLCKKSNSKAYQKNQQRT